MTLTRLNPSLMCVYKFIVARNKNKLICINSIRFQAKVRDYFWNLIKSRLPMIPFFSSDYFFFLELQNFDLMTEVAENILILSSKTTWKEDHDQNFAKLHIKP